MSSFDIRKENDRDGLWFCVYVQGRYINGFRSCSDAYLFAEWYTRSGQANTITQGVDVLS